MFWIVDLINIYLICISLNFLSVGQLICDAPFPGGPLTTRQPAEYKWMSGYPTPLQKIGQSLPCTGSSTQIKHLHENLSQAVQYNYNMSKTTIGPINNTHHNIPTMNPTIYPIVTRVNMFFTLIQHISNL